jgi:hypothetical protein
MARLRLLLRPGERTAAAILNVVPLPGLGALLAGWRNAHTTLRRNGALQMALVVLGSWPLIVPGAAGLAWAVWDTVRIARADLRRLPPGNEPDPPAEPQARPPARRAAPPKAARR